MTRTGTRVVARAALPLAAAATAALLGVMFYYPVGAVLLDAVTRTVRTPGGTRTVFTLSHLAGVLTDSFYVGFLAAPGEALAAFPDLPLGLFGFTAYQAALSTLAAVALGLPLAYLLARFEFPGRRTVYSLTALPFVMPSIMVAVGFVATFGRNGTINDALRALGLPTLDLLFTLEIIVLAHAFYDAPLVARITAAAWEGIDARTVETARTMGASPRRAFLHVVAPQLLPAVLTGALLTFVFSFLSFAIVLALGGLELATVEVWVYHSVRQLEYNTAAAIAVLETAVSLGLMYAYLRFEARQRAARAVRPPERDRLFGTPTPTRVFAWGYVALALVVFVLPLASMVLASVSGPQGFTLRHYGFLLRRQAEAAGFQVRPLTAVWNSLLFAAGSLLLALPMGVAVAVLSTRDFRGRKVVDALAMAPLAVSGIVVGLGLLRGLVFGVTAFGYRFTATGAVAVVAAHAVAGYPFVARTVAPMLATLDRSLVESARALGATRVRALLDVELPLVLSGVLAGAAFALAISMGEFDSTVILATGSGEYTMPVAIERFLGRRLGPATAMGCVLLLVTAVSFVVVDRVGGYFDG
jgi:thiamine transport system permease protein